LHGVRVKVDIKTPVGYPCPSLDTEANRLCAKAIKAGEKRPKGGDPNHFDFWEQVVTEMMGKLKKRQLEELQLIAKEYNKKGLDPKLKSK